VNLFRTILIVVFCVYNANLLIAQKPTTKGVILSKSDSSKIIGAHIINITSEIGVTSNQNGIFSIQTKPKDTLIISFIGYKSLKIEVPEIPTNIYLEREIYSIAPYTVLPYKNFRAFREAFTNLEIEDTDKHKMNPSILVFTEPFYPNNINGGISFNGPISALAALFNKRIKDRKNYERLMAKDKYEALIAKKFNSSKIKQTTLLKNENEINAFMEYCDFTDQFIEFSSQYKLFDEIINCFEEYNSLPMANK
jgi:hypothetical protein